MSHGWLFSSTSPAKGKGSHPAGSGHPPQSFLCAMELGRALSEQGDGDPTWSPLLQIPLQGVGWGRGGRELAAGRGSELGSSWGGPEWGWWVTPTHSRSCSLCSPMAAPMWGDWGSGGLGGCGPPGTAVISGSLPTESCTRQGGLCGILHPMMTHQCLPCFPLLMPCSIQPSSLIPGQCRVSLGRRGAHGRCKAATPLPNLTGVPSTPFPGIRRARIGGLVRQWERGVGSRRKDEGKSSPRCLFYKAFNSLY